MGMAPGRALTEHKKDYRLPCVYRKTMPASPRLGSRLTKLIRYTMQNLGGRLSL